MKAEQVAIGIRADEPNRLRRISWGGIRIE